MKKLRRTLLVLLAIAALLAALTYKADIDPAAIEQKYSFPDSKFFDLDGMKVHYRIQGDTGEYVVLLHGTASSLHTWQDWSEVLSTRYRVVSFDLPGFGLTGPDPQNDYSRQRYVKFVHDVLQHLDVDSCCMAGNSFGGFLAWNYAVAYPDEVKELALLDASGYPRKGKALPLSFSLMNQPWLKPVLTRFTPRFLVSQAVKTVFYDDRLITDKLVDRYYELLLRKGNRAGLMGKMTQIKYDNSDRIKLIHCPTLIMWGKDDKLVNVENASRFHTDIAGSELVIYPKVGHVPMEESPQRSVKDFMAFLSR